MVKFFEFGIYTLSAAITKQASIAHHGYRGLLGNFIVILICFGGNINWYEGPQSRGCAALIYTKYSLHYAVRFCCSRKLHGAVITDIIAHWVIQFVCHLQVMETLLVNGGFLFAFHLLSIISYLHSIRNIQFSLQTVVFVFTSSLSSVSSHFPSHKPTVECCVANVLQLLLLTLLHMF